MRWTKSENVIWEELDGGALLIDSNNGSCWTLSASAAAAWKLCDGKRTLSEMTRALRQSQESIADFCEQFEALGLLRNQSVACTATASFRTSRSTNALSFKPAGLGSGPRRRPSPRGNSGPG